MGENVIVIVDLGHDDCELIRKDVESLGVRAEVCEYEADADYLNSLGEIKGIIFDGGSGKMVNGFRAEPSESFYDLKVPVYSVDHASREGVDLYKWPENEDDRRWHIRNFMTTQCGMKL